MTTTRTLIADDADGRLYTLRRVGERHPYAIEAAVQANGLTYSREFPLNGSADRANEQLAAARQWCKRMAGELSGRTEQKQEAASA